MVAQESLSRIRTNVERAYADHFGAHETEMTLEPFVDHYGYDMVDVIFVFDEMPPPPRMGGGELLQHRQVREQCRAGRLPGVRDLQGTTAAEKRALAIHVLFRERSV